MLQQLNEKSSEIGSQMNLSQTKIMTNVDLDTHNLLSDIFTSQIEIRCGHQTTEIKRRIGIA